jgi:Zn-dependent metalloprotease
MKKRKLFFGFGAFVILVGFVAVWMARPSAAQVSDPVEVLRQQTDGNVRVSYHAETGKVRFIGADQSHPMQQPAALKSDATAEDAARQFLSVYGSAFGLVDPAQELALERSKTTEDGRSVVRFQQTYQGIPVLGGELIVQMNQGQQVLSVSGEALPDLKLGIAPSLDAETARQHALATVAKTYGLSVDTLATTPPELWVFSHALLGGPGPRLSVLVWRMDVTPNQLLPIQELVLVEAHTGAVVLQFNQVDTARNRQTYTANNGTTLPGTLVCNEADPTCSAGDNDAQNAHIFAGSTYDFYLANHNRDSIDNAGMALISTVHYDSGYANAFWNGQQMVYGDAYGFADADDVIAHELTHGVTDYESRMFYYYQTGAINESFSDVWGEFVDLSDGLGDDSAGVRWLMGEDVTGLGAIRDMENPPAFNDPDRIGSVNYTCDVFEEDRGGVHTNSGVNNKAVFLMTDGGSFNGQTVTGLGIAKVADIYYEVQTNLFTSAGDYQDLHDDLVQACSNLVGVGGITAGDCAEVQKAILAVEMNTQPTGCAAPEAPVCPAGQTPNNIFFDNLENTSSGNWTSSAIAPYTENQWYYPQNTNPFGFDATYASSGSYNFWAYDVETDSDYAMAMNSGVLLPAGTVYMHFEHAFGFDGDDYDGAVVEYSAGAGAWTDAGTMFTDNGYTGVIASGFSNPLGGRSGFVGESYGYISSRLNLSTLAGQNVKFRFRMGTDSSAWDWGWFIDDIRIYTCGAAVPTATRTNTPTKTNTPIGWTPHPTKENFLPHLRKDKTPTPTVTPTATPAQPTATPNAPLPGLWVQNDSCFGCSEFYVTTDSSHVDNFAAYISVSGCGNYKITYTPLVAITNKAFSFTGKFYANGTFDTYSTAHGKTGFNKFYIAGCGYITGSMNYTSAWYNSTQPFTLAGEDWLVEPASGLPSQPEHYFEVMKTDQ